MRANLKTNVCCCNSASILVLDDHATGGRECLPIDIWRIRCVAWRMRSYPGNHGRGSLAMQIADEHYWPEIRAVILVVSDAKKDSSSTDRMSTSVSTFELLLHRWIPISSTHVFGYLPADILSKRCEPECHFDRARLQYVSR